MTTSDADIRAFIEARSEHAVAFHAGFTLLAFTVDPQGRLRWSMNTMGQAPSLTAAMLDKAQEQLTKAAQPDPSRYRS